MKRELFTASVVFFSATLAAAAQVTGPILPQTQEQALGTIYVPISIRNSFTDSCGVVCVPGAVGGVSAKVPLSAFASSSDLAATNAAVSAFGKTSSKAMEGAALGIAMKDAIPDEGDRFAVRFNAGGFSNQAAGGLGVAARLDDGVRANLNWARSSSQNAVSAGVNFSFN